MAGIVASLATALLEFCISVRALEIFACARKFCVALEHFYECVRALENLGFVFALYASSARHPGQGCRPVSRVNTNRSLILKK